MTTFNALGDARLTRKVPSTILAYLIGYNPVVVANRADSLAEPWHADTAHRSRCLGDSRDERCGGSSMVMRPAAAG